MSSPPLSSGASTKMVSDRLFDEMESMVGAPGVVAERTDCTNDAVPRPLMFTIARRKLYEVPFVKPEITIGLADDAELLKVHVVPPSKE